MSTLHIECFGRFRTVTDGTARPIRGGRQQHLLSALVLARHSGLSVTEVLEELYGENTPDSRENAARMAVKRLRETLGGAVAHDGNAYRLMLPDDAVDIWRFQDAIVNRPDDPLHTLSLWTGTPFPDTDLSPAAQLARQSLERLRLAALETLAWKIDKGANEAAIDDLLVAATSELDQEDLVAATAAALYRLGRQTDALQLMTQTRRTLIEEFGVAPKREFEAVELAILNHRRKELDAQPRPPGALPAAVDASPVKEVPRGAQPEARFFGRTELIRQLTANLADARLGPGRFVSIVGEAGAGKTMLVNRLLVDSEKSGFASRVGTGGLGDSVAFGPILEALPELADHIDALINAPDAETGRLLFCRAAERVIDQLRRERDLLVVIEDIHEVDSQTTHLLRYLASVSLPAGVVVMVTMRPHAANSQADALARSLETRPNVANMTVEPLDRDALFDLVSHDHPDESVAVRMRFVEVVEQQSNGNALVASIISKHAPAGLSVGSPELGASVLSVVDRRLSGSLSASALEMLAAAATIGLEFDLAQLVRLLGVPIGDVLDVIEEAAAAGVVAETSVDDRFRFCHALMAAACESHLISHRRRQLCARLLLDPATDPAHVVRYVVGAGGEIEENLAIEQLLRSATGLQEQFAHAEAATAWDVLLQMMEPADERYLPALIDHARCVAQTGQPVAASEIRDAAYNLAVRSQRTDLVAAIAMSGLEGGETLLGEPGRLQIFEAVELESLDAAERERVLASWIRHERITGNVDRARELLAQHPDVTGLLDVERILIDVFSPEVTPCASQLARLASQLTGHAEYPFVRHRLLWAALVEQVPGAATTLFDEVWIDVRNDGRPNELWSMHVLDAALNVVGMRESASTSATALEAGLRLGNPNATDTWMGQLMTEALLVDKLGDTAEIGMAAISESPTPGRRAGVALALYEAGRIEEARDMTTHVVGGLGQLHHSSEVPAAAALLAELAYGLKMADAATEALRWLRSRSGQAVLLGIGAGYLGPVDRYIAIAEHVLEHSDSARTHAQRAVEQAAQSGSALWLSRCGQTQDDLMKGN